MTRGSLLVVIACLTVAVSGIGHDAAASGIILYELGTPDLGRASAGWAARADDAATIFTNPAGMSRLPDQQLLVGVQPVYGQFGFKPDENTTVEGNDGGNPIGWMPGGSVFYTHQLSSHWSAGIGAFSYFGLAAEYDQDWVGRHYVQKSALIGLTLMPAVSYRVDEHLSFGAGLNWMFGALEQKQAVKNILEQTDGALKFSDNTQGFGGNFGVLAEMTDRTRLGLTYLTPVELEFKDTPEFTGLGPLMEAGLEHAGILGAEIDLGMKVPHMLMASVYHDLCGDWALMGNLGWQNWSSFGKMSVSVADTLLALTTDLDFEDTWHAAFGAEWDASPQWLVTGGIAYDSSPVNDENRTVALPMGETWRFGVGGQWEASDSIELGFGYQLGWMGNLPVDQHRQLGQQIINRVAGQYESTALHTFAVNLRWRI